MMGYERGGDSVTTRPEYWCDRSLLVTLDGPDGRRIIRVEKPFARIAAHEASEVVLQDHRIAGQSLYLHATESGVFYLVLPRSTPGRPSPAGWLQPKQQIPFGPYLVSAQLADQKEDPPSVPEPDLTARGAIADPRPLVAVSLDDHELATCRLSRRLTVLGSHRSSNVQLKGGHVCDTHAILYWSNPTLWVVDLLSPVGTLFEGRPIEAMRLPEGESIVLGNVTLTLCSPLRGHNDAPPQNAVATLLPFDGRRLRRQVSRLIARKKRFEARQAQWEQQRRQTEAELNEVASRLNRQRTELNALANRLTERQAELETMANRLEQPSQETLSTANLGGRSADVNVPENGYASFPPDATDEDPDRLVQHVTGRLVASQRGAVLRRAAKQLAVALLLMLATAGAIFLLHHYADALRNF
jgi:hypothetical protein